MRSELQKTDQQLFDAMIAHLRAQGGPAIGGGGVCMYRTMDGRKCPVGALIPDDLYRPEMEGRDVTSLSKSSRNDWMDRELGDFFREHLPMLKEVQYIHDAFFPEDWERGFQNVAAKFHLLLDGQGVDIPPERNPLVTRGSPGTTEPICPDGTPNDG